MDLEAFVIDPVPKDISRLKEAVHQKIQPELSHCSAASLQVYAPGTNLTDCTVIGISATDLFMTYETQFPHGLENLSAKST
jgi:hypothetical protein